ncbi:MAG: tetratricopeptide repeat protein [Planctomycetes bacterium]|nr:tetratricopeptide repeat protein [Planctomycetota bacterium]
MNTTASPPNTQRDCTTKSRRVSLPVVSAGPDGKAIRPSKSGKWRAASLLAVHVLVLAHVAHWLIKGKTLTPVEPSESMETIRTGAINAGFVFFAVAIALTLIFGRFVCGWACHLVAYQDLTLWVLKKLHLRPKPFRSRLLIFVPAFAAFYMFFWPAVYRMVVGLPHPELTWHLSRTGFWDTFPDYGIAILTVLLCGMAIIYFLGAKGFCTYACPYGALFGIADKVAVARIRVTDACQQCGHCTAVCTSNVDVAREVKLYKMVVDPGCMKCLDCVSVCPNDALYVGFGTPSLFAKASEPPKSSKYDLTFAEELFAAIMFVGAFFAYRGLYGNVPFLLSLGVAGMFAFLLHKAAQMIYLPDVMLQRIRLKLDGRAQPAGRAFMVGVVLLLAFTAHSGFWRYHDYLGQRIVAELPGSNFGWQRDANYFATLAPDDRSRAADALAHLRAAERWGLMHPVDNDIQIAWLELITGARDDAATRTRRVAEAHPDDAGFWVKWANTETFLGRFDIARIAFTRALEIEKARRESMRKKLPDEPLPESAHVWTEWGLFLADRGDATGARAALSAAVQHDPTSSLAWLAWGSFQISTMELDAARSSLIKAVRLSPDNRPAIELLERIVREDQNFAAAVKDYEQAAAAQPDRLIFRHNLAHSLARVGRYPEAIAIYRAILTERPAAAGIRAELGATLMATGDLTGAVNEYELLVKQMPDDAEANLRLGILYQQAGRTPYAITQLEKASKLGGPEADTAQQLLQELRKP